MGDNNATEEDSQINAVHGNRENGEAEERRPNLKMAHLIGGHNVWLDLPDRESIGERRVGNFWRFVKSARYHQRIVKYT